MKISLYYFCFVSLKLHELRFHFLINSFGFLASDSPSNDQNSYITPSPAGGDSLAPKAPVKKVCCSEADANKN